jgi:hypothetical protein
MQQPKHGGSIIAAICLSVAARQAPVNAHQRSLATTTPPSGLIILSQLITPPPPPPPPPHGMVCGGVKTRPNQTTAHRQWQWRRLVIHARRRRHRQRPAGPAPAGHAPAGHGLILALEEVDALLLPPQLALQPQRSERGVFVS